MLGMFYVLVHVTESNFVLSIKGEECIPQTWDMFHEKYVSCTLRTILG